MPRFRIHTQDGRLPRWVVLLLALGASLLLSGALCSSAALSQAAPGTPIYMNTAYSFEERAADLVSRMTLAEKVAQLRTNSAPAIPRLGVQQYTYWSEGQHGIDALGANTNPGSVGGGVHATSFPTNFASAMSWDPALIYSETTAISDEARGFLDKSLWGVGQNNIGPSENDYGSLTFWAPTVNMDRDPRWGRTDEAFGEDPYLTSQLGSAFVDGYQGDTTSGQPETPYLKVAATAKHYALNNVENSRQSISSNTNDTDLHDYYTAPFRSLTENAHVSGIMTSVNAVNGTPAMADSYTDNQVAQRTYGFQGYTTSDCSLGAIYRADPYGHSWAPPGWTSDGGDTNAIWTNTASSTQVSGAAGAEAFALRAGTDLNCTGTEATLSNIEQAIGAGILSEGVIDSALVRIFTTRMMTGEFDPPSQVAYAHITKDVIQSPAHQSLAEQVAANSLVLLKNALVPGTSAPLLPANASSLNKVVVVGDLANKVTLGGYSGVPSLRVSAVQGITAAVRAANPNASVVFDAAGTSTTTSAQPVLSAQTQADIQAADLVLVFVGTDRAIAGEGHDRSTLAVPGNYNALIDQVAALGNPRMVLVVQSDGPLAIEGEQGKFPAVLFSGYNGESQGAALAQVLFGTQDPSGHLNFTWYRDDSQLPDMSNYGLTPSATGGLGRTYMYFTGTPTYPFGYGLSYTQFSFSNLVVTPQPADGTVNVSFVVKNTGSAPGAAVPQLYVATPFTVPGKDLPRKRLEGFQKTELLQPGQTQSITLTINIADLAFWDQASARSVVYGGPYQFQLAFDAGDGDIAASQTVNIAAGPTPQVKYVTVQPEDVTYEPGEKVDLTGKNRWIADDTNHALEQRNLGVQADNIVEAVRTDGSFVDLSHAQVSYASSDSSVATVSSSGILTAVAPGVATIFVTVNGITGSAAVVVKQPLALHAPAAAPPGSTFTATSTLPNPGSTSLNSVQLTLTAPGGWTVTAVSPSRFGTVPGGQIVQTTWRVTVPATASPASYQLSTQATFSSPEGEGSASDISQVSVPYPSFASAYDNPGISDDSSPASGNLDGGGLSYSAQALAGVGLTPGATITHDGVSFTWPNVASGTPDNVTALGQTIALAGYGPTLGFLGTSDHGSASGNGTVVYTDGTTQPFILSFANWWAGKAAPGGEIVATAPYINSATGQRQRSASIYYASVPLQPGKAVQYVTLPDMGQSPTQGRVAMHIFAIGALTPPGAPVVSTGTAADVSPMAATVNGTANPNGLDVTDCHFEGGRTTAYGITVPCFPPPGAGAAPVTVFAKMTGLAPDTTYHFRLVATNPDGTSYGADRTFTTPPLPPAVPSFRGRIGTLGSLLKLTFVCAGVAVQSCQGQVRASAIEKLSSDGKRIIGVLPGKPRTGHYRVVVVLDSKLSASGGQTTDVGVHLNPTGLMLRSRFKKLPADVNASATAGKRTAIRTAKVIFGPDPPSARIVGTPATKRAIVTFTLRCHALALQVCTGRAQIITFAKRGADGKTITGLAGKPASKGTPVVLANVGWSVKPNNTAQVAIAINRTGRTLLSRFGRIPAVLTLTPTYGGYALTAISKEITFKR